MDSARKKELKAQAQQLSPVIAIGRQGLTNNNIIQIKNYLQAHKLAKIKFSPSLVANMKLSKKEFAQLVAEKTGAQLINQIGFVLTLWKR